MSWMNGTFEFGVPGCVYRDQLDSPASLSFQVIACDIVDLAHRLAPILEANRLRLDGTLNSNEKDALLEACEQHEHLKSMLLEEDEEL